MIILASNSPRRKQLLAFGGWPFQVYPVHINEEVLKGEAPDMYVLRLSREKAEAAFCASTQNFPENGILISADTSVVFPLDDENRNEAMLLPEFRLLEDPSSSSFIILGKPLDEQHAEQILKLLRNRIHQVYTGLTALRIKDGYQQSLVCVTDVPMRDYDDDEIKTYIASGDPFDKAGAYAIQHKDFRPAQQLQGCYANVMGLPVCHLAVLLKKMDERPYADIAPKCLEEFDYSCPISNQILTQGM